MIKIKVTEGAAMKELRRAFRKFPNNAKRANKRVAREASKYAVMIAKGYLALQNFTGADIPLSDTYRKRKLAEGYEDLILVKTATYYNAIKSHKITDYHYLAGVLPGTVIKGVDYYLVMLLLEYGTRTMPARPLWSDVGAKMEVKTPELFESIYREEFGGWLK